MKRGRRALLILLLVTLFTSMFPSAALAADDWDIPGGHFFSQTGGGAGKGYSITDDSSAKFWTQFQNLGGVNAVGYPASRRFQWDGFTVQVFQRVIFQWHPEMNSVTFVNTFDRLHDLGKDDWLAAAKQTPRPSTFNEAGFTWDQIVADRLAVLDAQPAIKAKYYAVVGDPIQANGLPTSTVTDEGSHWAVRAQRVEFQLWKQDVPWAAAGTVTVALGGDIAKESGILPDVGALVSGTPEELASGTSTPAATPTPAGGSTAGWPQIKDGEKSFSYPPDWQAASYADGTNLVVSKDTNAGFFYFAPFNMGPGFNQQDFIVSNISHTANGVTFTYGSHTGQTVNGNSVDMVQYTATDGRHGVIGTIQKSGRIYLFITVELKNSAATNGPNLTAIINSYQVLAS